MNWNFPEIKTTRTEQEQTEKILDEINEFKSDLSDEECVDIFHAAETLLRIKFKGREHDLNVVINRIVQKNVSRGYYSTIVY